MNWNFALTYAASSPYGRFHPASPLGITPAPLPSGGTELECFKPKGSKMSSWSTFWYDFSVMASITYARIL